VAPFFCTHYFFNRSDLLWVLCPPIVNIISFLTFVLTGHELTIGIIFSSMLLFNILRWPLISLPWVISDGVQARVSVNRIQEFLLSEELEEFQKRGERPPIPIPRSTTETSAKGALVQTDEDVDEELSISSEVSEESAVARIGAALSGVDSVTSPAASSATGSAGAVVRISNGTFSWTKSVDKPDLRNINLTALQGQLVVIIGHVGSGKSSILSALLGEMRTVDGSYSIHGSCAYAAQQPWIMHDTVKNNITMGLDYDSAKYQSVVESCALVRDLEILPGGSSCEIGEKGVSLSGGQKARVALARAVYRDADVYLLDDIFAAVDVHVARHIFDEAVLKTLAGKTRILVTHHYFTLPKADFVIYMKNGEVSAAGTFQQLQTQGISLLELMTDEKGKAPSDGEDPEVSADLSPASPSLETKSAAKLDDNEKDGKSVNDEERETGQLKGSVMRDYIFLCGIVMTCLVIFFTFGDQGTSMFRDWYLTNWARNHEVPSVLTPSSPPEPTFVIVNDILSPTADPVSPGAEKTIDATEVRGAMLVYCLLALGAAVIRITEEALLIIGTLRASKSIHDRTLTSVFRAPIQFFDTTPIGRILNRFSKDQDSVDNEIAPQRT
jgi:ABC-type multidrug transport system fused ATPase/permease subunit